MIISMIAAVAQNNVIGKNNDLPWRLPDDMRYFMQVTKGHHVIMGRKNYQSIPEKYRPLPDRTNIVISRQKDFIAPGCIVIPSLEDALTMAQNAGEPEVFLIGGSQVYKDGLAVAQRLYITRIHSVFDGDVFFPEVNWNDWMEVSKTHHPTDERHKYAFDFLIFERR